MGLHERNAAVVIILLIMVISSVSFFAGYAFFYQSGYLDAGDECVRMFNEKCQCISSQGITFNDWGEVIRYYNMTEALDEYQAD